MSRRWHFEIWRQAQKVEVSGEIFRRNFEKGEHYLRFLSLIGGLLEVT